MRSTSRARITNSRTLLVGGFTGIGGGGANCGAAGACGIAGGAMPGTAGACGICGICGKPAAGGAAGEALPAPMPGMLPTAIMRVYSLGPVGALGTGPSGDADGSANAWVAPADTPCHASTGGAAGAPSPGGNPDATGNGGP